MVVLPFSLIGRPSAVTVTQPVQRNPVIARPAKNLFKLILNPTLSSDEHDVYCISIIVKIRKIVQLLIKLSISTVFFGLIGLRHESIIVDVFRWDLLVQITEL